MDPLAPTFPCDDPPTRPKCAKASANISTAPIRHSCPASCFRATLSRCSCNLRSACHNSFTLHATSTLLCFPLMLDSAAPPVASKSSLVGVSGGRSHHCFWLRQGEQEFPPSGLLQGSPRKSQPLRWKKEKGGTYHVWCNTCRPSTSSCHQRMMLPQSMTQQCQHTPVS